MRRLFLTLFVFGLGTTAFVAPIKPAQAFVSPNATCSSRLCTEDDHTLRYRDDDSSGRWRGPIRTSVNGFEPIPTLKNWDNRQIIDAKVVIVAGTPSASDEQSAGVTAEDAEEYEFGLLVNAPGVETTYYTCIACHSERIVAQQGLSRKSWDELLDWMIEKQGMSELDDQERLTILDYLSVHYNEDRPNFPRPKIK